MGVSFFMALVVVIDTISRNSRFPFPQGQNGAKLGVKGKKPRKESKTRLITIDPANAPLAFLQFTQFVAEKQEGLYFK